MSRANKGGSRDGRVPDFVQFATGQGTSHFFSLGLTSCLREMRGLHKQAVSGVFEHHISQLGSDENDKAFGSHFIWMVLGYGLRL